MAKPTAARVVRKAPAARASPSGNRASHAADRRLRGPNRVQASNAPERQPQRASSAENEITLALQKLSIKVGKASHSRKSSSSKRKVI
jgi:hypothetical protein